MNIGPALAGSDVVNSISGHAELMRNVKHACLCQPGPNHKHQCWRQLVAGSSSCVIAPGNPLHIARAIVSVPVDSVNGQPVGVSPGNGPRLKCGKVIPLTANGNAAGVSTAMLASRPHVHPNCVKRGAGGAVRNAGSSPQLGAPASAGLRDGIFKMRTRDDGFAPTVAYAPPSSAVSADGADSFQYRKAAEFLARKIKRFVAHKNLHEFLSTLKGMAGKRGTCFSGATLAMQGSF